MSHIIQQNSLQSQRQDSFSESSTKEEYYFLEQIKLLLEKFYCNSNTRKEGHKMVFQAQLIVTKLLPSFCITITLNLQSKMICTIFVISHQGIPLSCGTKYHRLQFMREYPFLSLKVVPPSFQIYAFLQNGLIMGKNIVKTKINKEYANFYCNSLLYLKERAELIILTFNQLFNFLSSPLQKNDAPLIVHLESSNLKHKQRLNKFLSLQMDVFKKKNYEKELVEEEQLFLNCQINQKFTQTSSILFRDGFDNDIFDEKTVQSIKFTESQLLKMNIHLKMPPLSSNIENRYIFNEIKIIKEYTQPIKTRIYGGLSEILLQKMDIEYECKQGFGVDLPKNKMKFTKLMAIKAPKQSSMLARFQEKTEHQLKILNILRDTESNFIIKHYVVRDQNYRFKNHVLTDFLDKQQTLDVFIWKRNQLMSLRTKLFLLIAVGEGLRVLNKFNIVHLDLSPSNFLVSSNFSTQVIDFGESYHPEVCGTNYRPGYTLPFVSPQRFKRSRKYQCSSDIFVFGILIYYTINMRTPFVPAANLVELFQNGRFDQKIFYPLQQIQYLGSTQSMRILYYLISRCMDPNPTLRPHINWCILILKQLFFFTEGKFKHF